MLKGEDDMKKLIVMLALAIIWAGVAIPKAYALLYAGHHVHPSGGIWTYDEATGDFVEALVPNGSGGLETPQDIVFGPDGNLYISSTNIDGIRRYDSETGAFIDVFAVGPSYMLEFGPDGNLYATDPSGNSILRYDGQTGDFIDVFAVGNGRPLDLAFGPDGNLYVSDWIAGDVYRYDGQTGGSIDALNPPGGSVRNLTFGPDGNLYVCEYNSDSVLKYDGQWSTFASGGGLDLPYALAFGNDGNLYVSSTANPYEAILRYDGETGAFIDEFISLAGGSWDPLLSLAFSPSSAPVPEPTTMLLFSAGLLGLLGISRRSHRHE